MMVDLFVPKADNDGAVFTEDQHWVFETFAASLFGGITMRGEVVGLWLGSKLFRDEMRHYQLGMTSLLDGDKLRQLLKYARAHYRQEAMFFQYGSVAEVFTEAT